MRSKRSKVVFDSVLKRHLTCKGRSKSRFFVQFHARSVQKIQTLNSTSTAPKDGRTVESSKRLPDFLNTETVHAHQHTKHTNEHKATKLQNRIVLKVNT